jgi:hypothetical protein
MRVPLTIAAFLARGETVYAHAVAVVDEGAARPTSTAVDLPGVGQTGPCLADHWPRCHGPASR